MSPLPRPRRTLRALPALLALSAGRLLALLAQEAPPVAGGGTVTATTTTTATVTVTVTATRTELRLLDTGASVLVLDPEALDDALRQVPGFTLFRRSGSSLANPTAQGVSLRGVGGSGASRAAVLLDGIPLNDPFGGWVTWSAVPRLAVARAEVLRGGGADVWGSPALAGAIGLVRRATGRDALALEVSGGSLGTGDAALFASGALGAWSASAAGEAFSTAGETAVAPEARGPVDTPVASRHRTLEFTLARALGASGRLFVTGSALSETRENGKPLETNDTTRRQLSAGADVPVLGGTLALRAFALDETYHQSFVAVNADRTAGTLTRAQEVPAEAYGGSGQLTRALGTHVLVAGFDVLSVRGRSDETLFTGGTPLGSASAGGVQRTAGAFLEDLFPVGARLRVTAALRYDAVRDCDGVASGTPLAPKTSSAFSPRLSLLYELSAPLALTASAYRSFRAPTLNELYRSFRVGDTLTLANSDLHPERLAGIEAGLLLRRTGPFEARLTLYEMELRDAIANVTLQVTPTLVTRRRKNLGRARTRGVELDLSARLASRLVLTAGWLLADARVTDAPNDPELVGRRLPQVPRHQLSLGARFRAPLGLLASAQLRWQSRVYEDDRNAASLGEALLLDARLSRELLRDLSLFVAGENLLDRRVETARTPVVTLAPGATVRAGVRLDP